MLRFNFLFVILLTFLGSLRAQTDSGAVPPKDTTVIRDSPTIIKPVRHVRRDSVVHTQRDTSALENQDSLTKAMASDSVTRKPFYATWTLDRTQPIARQLIAHHPYFGFGSAPVIVHSDLKRFKGKEVFFYAMIGLLLAFSFLRQSFPKYFNDMFRLLFRNTLKQKQIREQLMQTTFPSLLLNVFFAVTAGLYIDLLLQHYGASPIDNFWLLLIYCSIGLSLIYLIKFIGLKLTGWLFNIRSAADSYIFVVFIINKVIGIFLLPFVVLLAFLQGETYRVVMVLSWCGLGILLIYRFLLTYTSIRNQVRFNPFHFFLYLCAFEIAPLLLIYKALLFFFQ